MEKVSSSNYSPVNEALLNHTSDSAVRYGESAVLPRLINYRNYKIALIG